MRFLILFILICVLGFFASQRIFNPQLNHNSISDRVQHPFDTRLRYKIGTIDPRFHINEDQLKNVLQQAADIWFIGTSKQYFIYDPNAQLSINLIYDQRQAESEARRSEISRLEYTKSATHVERQKLKVSESDLNMQQRQVEQLKISYQARLEHYNQQVQNFNQSQNRSPAIRDYLEMLKQQLETDQINIQQQINQFNLNVVQLNQQVNTINHMNDQFNASVDQFNVRFQPRQFDKGVFNGREINIYEFENLDDLRLTLAHELGHGLGLMHSNDPESLMYPILEKQDFKNFHLKTADLALLSTRN